MECLKHLSDRQDGFDQVLKEADKLKDQMRDTDRQLNNFNGSKS